jgi:hypothetical protein
MERWQELFLDGATTILRNAGIVYDTRTGKNITSVMPEELQWKLTSYTGDDGNTKNHGINVWANWLRCKGFKFPNSSSPLYRDQCLDKRQLVWRSELVRQIRAKAVQQANEDKRPRGGLVSMCVRLVPCVGINCGLLMRLMVPISLSAGPFFWYMK